MFNWLQIAAGAALGALVCAVPMYWYGHVEGVNSERINQLKASVDAQIKREGIDNEVTDMDRYAICLDLGGLRDDCEQLRRMEEAAKAE